MLVSCGGSELGSSKPAENKLKHKEDVYVIESNNISSIDRGVFGVKPWIADNLLLIASEYLDKYELGTVDLSNNNQYTKLAEILDNGARQVAVDKNHNIYVLSYYKGNCFINKHNNNDLANPSKIFMASQLCRQFAVTPDGQIYIGLENRYSSKVNFTKLSSDGKTLWNKSITPSIRGNVVTDIAFMDNTVAIAIKGTNSSIEDFEILEYNSTTGQIKNHAVDSLHSLNTILYDSRNKLLVSGGYESAKSVNCYIAQVEKSRIINFTNLNEVTSQCYNTYGMEMDKAGYIYVSYLLYDKTESTKVVGLYLNKILRRGGTFSSLWQTIVSNSSYNIGDASISNMMIDKNYNIFTPYNLNVIDYDSSGFVYQEGYVSWISQ
jgi:hypothetical protein